MLLAFDVGNTQILGGVFKGDKLLFKFRKRSESRSTSDELGVFFKNVLRENEVNPAKIKSVAICSVVPDMIYPLYQSVVKYFGLKPFLIGPGVKTGLNLKYKNPGEIGADRVANAMGAVELFGGKNMIVADLGTATTFCIISEKKEYLGGIIMPGIKLSANALSNGTAKLPKIEIVKPKKFEGKTTVDAMQCGIYYSNYFAIKGIMEEIKKTYFPKAETVMIGTGGFSKIFEGEGLFTHISQDIVLIGIKKAFEMNKKEILEVK